MTENLHDFSPAEKKGKESYSLYYEQQEGREGGGGELPREEGSDWIPSRGEGTRSTLTAGKDGRGGGRPEGGRDKNRLGGKMKRRILPSTTSPQKKRGEWFLK